MRLMPRPICNTLLLMGGLACQGKLVTISVEKQSTTTVEGGSILENLLGDLGFDSFVSMDLTQSEELQNQGVEPGDIVDVRLVYLELEALSPPGADLSFIDSMDVYVSAPGLDEVRVASADDFPEGQAVVSFDIADVDLTDYVVSESMTLRTDVTGHRPDEDTEVEARFAVDVGVTVKGACSGR